MKKVFISAILTLGIIGSAFAGRTATGLFNPQIQVFEGKVCTANPNSKLIVIVHGSTPCTFLLDGTPANTEWYAMLKDAVARGKQVSLQYESNDKPMYMLYNGEYLNIYRLRCVEVR